MSTWKAALAVLIIFILGTVFGVTLSYWIMPRMFPARQPALEILTERLNQRFMRSLSLSPEQEQKIEGIIQDARSQLAEIRDETRPRVRQIIQTARERIRAELTPEQKARFNRIQQRNRRRPDRLITR